MTIDVGVVNENMNQTIDYTYASFFFKNWSNANDDTVSKIYLKSEMLLSSYIVHLKLDGEPFA